MELTGCRCPLRGREHRQCRERVLECRRRLGFTVLHIVLIGSQGNSDTVAERELSALDVTGETPTHFLSLSSCQASWCRGEDSQTISVKTISQPPTHSLKGLNSARLCEPGMSKSVTPDDLIIRVLPLQSMGDTSELWVPSLSGVEIFTTAHTQSLKIWL